MLAWHTTDHYPRYHKTILPRFLSTPPRSTGTLCIMYSECFLLNEMSSAMPLPLSSPPMHQREDCRCSLLPGQFVRHCTLLRRLIGQILCRASVYGDTWTMPKPPSSNDFGAPARAAPPLVSPRPSYAYGRTEFAESDNGSSDTHHSRQRTWSPTSSSWR